MLVLALIAISIPVLTSGGGARRRHRRELGRAHGRGRRHRGARRGARPATRRERGRVREPVGRAAGPRCRDPPRPGRRLGRRTRSPSGTSPPGLAVDEESVWVTNAVDGTVDRINPRRGRSARRLPAGSAPNGIAVGDGFLWIADSNGAALLRVDPSSGDARDGAARRSSSGVAFTPDGVWVSIAPDSVARIDPAGPERGPHPTGGERSDGGGRGVRLDLGRQPPGRDRDPARAFHGGHRGVDRGRAGARTRSSRPRAPCGSRTSSTTRSSRSTRGRTT